MINTVFIGVKDDPDLRGLMPNSFHHIFSYVNGSKLTQFLIRASYLEIYKEEIRDLLRKDSEKQLKIKETPDRGVYVAVSHANSRITSRICITHVVFTTWNSLISWLCYLECWWR